MSSNARSHGRPSRSSGRAHHCQPVTAHSGTINAMGPLVRKPTPMKMKNSQCRRCSAAVIAAMIQDVIVMSGVSSRAGGEEPA